MYSSGARFGSGMFGGGVALFGIQVGWQWLTAFAILSMVLAITMMARRVRRTSATQRP